jgi:hypothetical protein
LIVIERLAEPLENTIDPMFHVEHLIPAHEATRTETRVKPFEAECSRSVSRLRLR